MINIILASSSPRRKELMQLLDIDFTVLVREIEELIDPLLSPEENVKQLALKKAMAIAADYPQSLIIGCDTVVVCDEKVLGKPKSPEHAKKMLAYLSGKEHYVCTGTALINLYKNIRISFYETTYVTMKQLDPEEIDHYVATGEPLDKAGAYGIQGKGAVYIKKITGDYYNVVGLPIHRLYEVLRQVNKEIFIKNKLQV